MLLKSVAPTLCVCLSYTHHFAYRERERERERARETAPWPELPGMVSVPLINAPSCTARHGTGRCLVCVVLLV